MMTLVSPTNWSRTNQSIGRFIAGTVVALLGLALMAAVMLAAYGRSNTAHHWQFTLGLAVPLLLSMAAQALIIIGAAIAGAALSRHRRR